MKSVNRIKVLFAVWAMLLAYCTFISNNPYFNAVAIFVGSLLIVVGFAYVLDNMTAKEEVFFNKIVKDF